MIEGAASQLQLHGLMTQQLVALPFLESRHADSRLLEYKDISETCV